MKFICFYDHGKVRETKDSEPIITTNRLGNIFKIYSIASKIFQKFCFSSFRLILILFFHLMSQAMMVQMKRNKKKPHLSFRQNPFDPILQKLLKKSRRLSRNRIQNQPLMKIIYPRNPYQVSIRLVAGKFWKKYHWM